MISFYDQDKNFAYPGFYNGHESSFINVDLNKSLDCSFIKEVNGSCQREDDRYNFGSNNEKDNNSFTYEYFPQSLEDELNGTRLEGDNELIKFFEEKEKIPRMKNTTFLKRIPTKTLKQIQKIT